MRVQFETESGSIYLLDHTDKTFLQLHPKQRTGPLFNSPVVQIGKRVEIWTSDDEKVARVIETGRVAKRKVLL